MIAAIPLALSVLAVAVAVMLGGSLLAGLLDRAWRPTSTRTIAALLMAPAVMALVGTLMLLSPFASGACHCLAHGLHHPHLCLAHPELAAPLLLPGAWLVVVWLMFVAPKLVQLCRDVVESLRWSTRVGDSAAVVDGVPVSFGACDGLGAVTTGFVRPRIMVDQDIWRALRDDEKRALVRHEEAHARRRDALTVVVLRLCCALSPLTSMTQLLARWRAAVELTCDAHAARCVGDPASVASALVAVERLRSQECAVSPVLAVAPGAALESRVMALLDGEPRRALVGNDVVRCLGFALLCVAAAAVMPGEWGHHAVETALGFIFHTR